MKCCDYCPRCLKKDILVLEKLLVITSMPYVLDTNAGKQLS